DAIITTGFLREAADELKKAGLTEANLTGRKYSVTRYHITGDPAGYIDHRDPILFPEIVHGNNASWSLLNGGDGDLHTSLLLRSSYGKGRLYVMAVPENDADLYRIPRAAVDVFKRALTLKKSDTYASGRNFSMFTYDDGSMILYRYVKADVKPEHVTLRTGNKVKALKCITDGRTIPVHEITLHEDFEVFNEYVADVMINPGEFKMYKWE
ncbi:MAG: hypothetical protein K6E63_01925, partial [Lachnospiraceae bacterium]|nr:hypothetical protein [Lachnospiraceae bacterium]